MTNAIAQPVWTTSKWLSRNEAARYIHVHNSVLNELIESGEIPASVGHGARCKNGDVIRINVDDLDRFMYAHPYVPKETAEAGVEEAAKELEKLDDKRVVMTPSNDEVSVKERAAYLNSIVNKPKRKRRKAGEAA